MDYQKPLYKSKGVLPKVKSAYQIEIIIFALIGIIFILLPLFSDVPSFIAVFGIFELIIAALLPKEYFLMNNSRLYIFDDRIVGIALNYIEANPEKLFPTVTRKQESLKFAIPFGEITNVQKGIPFLSQIIITHGEKKYQIAVKDVDKAYQILCDHVFGEVSSNVCVHCGHEISAMTETCPSCGHITRYGKVKRESEKKQRIDTKFQIQSLLWAIVFIIGLIILIPAAIDLNEISSYAGLYASIYPSRAKKIVAKFILGLILTCASISFPLVKLILKKVVPPQD